MLPWTISRDGVDTTSYDFQVVQAVTMFLPASEPNVDALSMRYAVETLANRLASGLQYRRHYLHHSAPATRMAKNCREIRSKF